MKKRGETFTINEEPKVGRPIPPKGQKIIWDKEFEDELGFYYESDMINFKAEEMLELFVKYLGMYDGHIFEDEGKGLKVKVKCKNGCIQIERID